MQMRMAGKRVILTGASRGIGFAAAERFLAEGAEVIGVSRDEANLRAASRRLGHKGFTTVLGDVGHASTALAAASAAEERWGAVDLLVNNAAIGSGGRCMEDLPSEELERVLRVNVIGPNHFIRSFVPLLRKGVEPRIINVSSGAGRLLGNPDLPSDMPCYRLSKLALDGLTVLWAGALRGQVSVLSFAPGAIRTDMTNGDGTEDPPAAALRLVAAALLPFEVTGQYVDGTRVCGWD